MQRTRLLSTTTLTLAGAMLLLASLSACGDDSEDDVCSGRTLSPLLAPVPLGDFYPYDENDVNPGNAIRTPYEWTLVLQAGCEEVQIDDICMVGSAGAVESFRVFYPEPLTASAGDAALVQVTYEREQPAPTDQVSMVIQSNATDFPTLVVPFCARVIEEGAEKVGVECEGGGIQAPPMGQRDDSLCGG